MGWTRLTGQPSNAQLIRVQPFDAELRAGCPKQWFGGGIKIRLRRDQPVVKDGLGRIEEVGPRVAALINIAIHCTLYPDYGLLHVEAVADLRPFVRIDVLHNVANLASTFERDG